MEIKSFEIQVNGHAIQIDVPAQAREVITTLIRKISLVLSTSLDHDIRSELITELTEAVIRVHGKKISLTGLIHCMDLLINGQPPFDRKSDLYGFDIRGLSRAIQSYVVEQRAQVGMSQPSDEVAMSLAERSLSLAQAMKQNPEWDQKLNQLFAKIAEKQKKTFQSEAPPKFRQYSTIMAYLEAAHRLDLDQVDQVVSQLMDVWAEEWDEDLGVSLKEYMRQRAGDLLTEVNAFGESETITQTIKTVRCLVN